MSTQPSSKEMEELKALMSKEALASESTESDKKTAYYRMKKAKEFANAYVFVKDLRTELLEAEPDLKITEALLADKLNELWSAKADNKSDREV